MLPVLLVLLFGVVEAGNLYEAQNLLSVAAREGARFGAMDRNALLLEGQTSNNRLIEDVKNFLQSSGLPKDDVTVSITEKGDINTPFDLDNPDNFLRYFEVWVEIPVSSITSVAPPGTGPQPKLVSSVVFRNAKAVIVN